MDDWAFATAPAPYGLGLTDERWWNSTPRELEALAWVRDQYILSQARLWATTWALYSNVHFRGDGHRQAWTIADFLPSERVTPTPVQMKATLDLQFGTGDVPEWALRIQENARKEQALNGRG